MVMSGKPPRTSALGAVWTGGGTRGFAGIAKEGGIISGTVPIEPGGWMVFNNNNANYVTYRSLRLLGVTAFSAWVWVKELGTGTALQSIVGQMDDPAVANGYVLYTSNNWTSTRFGLVISATYREALGALPAVTAGEARLLVGTWATGDYVRLYHNGVQIGISGATYAGSISEVTIQQLLISKTFNYPLTGKVRDFGTVNRQLSNNEVAQLYANSTFR